MRYRLLLCLSIFLLSAAAWAQTEVEFKALMYREGNEKGIDSLPFQLVLPANYQPNISYPLMVLLHGSGERGLDNQKQLTHFLPLVNNSTVRKKYPFIFVIPQCPEGKSWSHAVFHRDSASFVPPSTATRPLELLHNLLTSLEKQYAIDANHRYISGLSMGGFGTLEYICYYPGYFKAAVPVCGGLSTTQFKKASKTPLWLFHGDADHVVKVAHSRKLVDYLRSKGKTVVYTELPGVQHNSWVATYANPLWLDWLWAQ